MNAAPWPDQGGNVVVIDGGVSQDRITIAGDNPIVFPDFSVGPPPVVVFGGWAGPPPGPPAGTGLVGPGGPNVPNVPTPGPGEDEQEFINRCVELVEEQGVLHDEAMTLCQGAWNSNPAARGAPNKRRRRL